MYGKIMRFMMDNGSTDKKTDQECGKELTAIVILGNGKKEQLTAKAFIFGLKVNKNIETYSGD